MRSDSCGVEEEEDGGYCDKAACALEWKMKEGVLSAGQMAPCASAL